MNYCRGNKEVIKILDRKDNIIDQLIELRKYHYKKGVRSYIDKLIRGNQDMKDSDSEYIIYCIIKYYYGLKVEEIKEPLPTLPFIGSKNYNEELIYDLLESKNNIIDQCKLLRENKNQDDILKYIDELLDKYYYDESLVGLNHDFEIYCINKYFYGLDVKKVKPSKIRLYA